MLAILSVFGSLSELATLGAVLPFVSLLSRPYPGEKYALVNQIVDSVRELVDAEPEQIITALFVSVIISSAILRLAIAALSVRLTQSIGHDLAVRVFDNIVRQPYEYHLRTNSSEILTAINKVSNVVTSVLTPGLDALVSCVLAMGIVAGLFLLSSKAVLLAAIAMGGVYWIIARISRGRITQNSIVFSRNSTAAARTVQEALGGIRDVILDDAYRFHRWRFQAEDAALRRAVADNNLWAQLPRHIVEAIGIAIIAATALALAGESSDFSLVMPVFATFALAAQRLLPLFQRIYSGWNSVRGNLGSLEVVGGFASMSPPQDDGIPAHAGLIPFNKNIELVGGGFRYTETTPWVFRNLTLQIVKGERIGLLGKTGCGKSTLLDIVMGLLKLSEGELRVDGTAITSDNVKHWRARLAHVPQSIFLADASIAENIALCAAGDEIDNFALERASRRAQFHSFVMSLPEGYATRVGERGVRLSGGQRQRIGIARALYRAADVIILDEATSALDTNTEDSVMKEIDQIGEGVTLIIVAHRLSTLANCDTVYAMDGNGQLSLFSLISANNGDK